MKPPEVPQPEGAVVSALAALGALAGAAVVRATPDRLLDSRGPLLAGCVLLALASLASAFPAARRARALSAVIAVLRLGIVMFALVLWRGEARELWGALAVWVAWRDADEGLCATHPLLPVALSLAATLAWAGAHGSPVGTRALLVAAVAALTVARATEARSRRPEE